MDAARLTGPAVPRAAGRPVPRASAARHLAGRIDGPALSAWTLGFALVAYLALRGGGFDTVVRGEAGVAVWWIVLIGAAAGVLPGALGRAGLAGVALLGAFAVWTAIGAGFSTDPGLTVAEAGRVATHLGVLVLALAVQRRTAPRFAVGGVATAVGLVTVLAILSRLVPSAFPSDEHLRYLGAVAARKLSWPFDYWNALAGFAAIGVPLLLGVAVSARRVAMRALAAAVLPLSALCLDLTLSRGGVIALVSGLLAFLALVPRRAQAIATTAVAGLGGVILVGAASRHPDLTGGILSPAAGRDGVRMLVLCALTCAGVACVQVALALADLHLPRPAWLPAGRRGTARAALAGVLAAAAIAIVVGAPAALERTWRDFKAPQGLVAPSRETTLLERLSAANGNTRYQYWNAAIHAVARHPLTGLGAGTFQFWWAQHGTTNGFVRHAHSLYFETLAETGVPGLLLLLGLFGLLAVVAVRRASSAPADAPVRVPLAAAAGGLAAFAASAAFEWVWQFGAIAAAVMVLAAVVLTGPGARSVARRGPPYGRIAAAALALAGLLAVSLPLAGELALRRSRADARAGDVVGALRESAVAARLEPFAAAPRLQRALLLESAGALGPAAAAATQATARAPEDWQGWLVRARLDARRGAARTAVADLREARRLDPRSPLFTTR